MRARWTFEDLARGQWQLVVQELAHGVSSQKVLEEIEELTNPKVKTGKKSLSPEQQQTKQLVLSQLESVRDESGKDAAVRLVFEPRTAKVDRNEFVRLLLANTSLQSSVSMNLVAVDRHGRPRSLSVLEVLGQWVSFRTETVRRRSAHRLAQAERRIHILEGRSIALLLIDEVIVVIRQSDEPKPALIARFGLTEVQAEDILEIRLRQLARLEAIKIERELSDLREQAGRLRGLLENEKTLRKAVSKEVQEDAKRYGDDRRTLIRTEAKATIEVPVLDELFETDDAVPKEERKSEITRELRAFGPIEERNVHFWFANRRREKKKKARDAEAAAAGAGVGGTAGEAVDAPIEIDD